MRAWLLLIPLLLAGCLSVTVSVDYNEQMQPISCHASYVSLAREIEGAAFGVCGSTATITKAHSAEVLRQLFDAALRGALP